MRKTIVIVAMSVLSCVRAQAQTSGETEVGTDNRDGAFASQYVFQDWQKANGFVRYFWVNGVVNRMEIAFGPTVKIGGATVKLQPGFTVGRQNAAKLAGVLVDKIMGRTLVYIGDKNWSVEKAESGWFYQKLFYSIDEHSVWQFRAESLHIGTDLVFLRIGGEYQIQFDSKRHIYIAPFYDPVVKAPGAQIGFRFN